MVIFNIKLHLFWGIALIILGKVTSILLMAGILLGSIILDCDTKKSYIGKLFPLWLLLGKNAHRKYTHSIIGLLLFSCLGIYINLIFGLGIGIGALIHLICDGSTMVGLPYLLYPFKYNREHWYFTRKLPWKEEAAP